MTVRRRDAHDPSSDGVPVKRSIGYRVRMDFSGRSISAHHDGIIGGANAERLRSDDVVAKQFRKVRLVDGTVIREINRAFRYGAATGSGVDDREFGGGGLFCHTAFLRQKPDGMDRDSRPMRGVVLVSGKGGMPVRDVELTTHDPGLPPINPGLDREQTKPQPPQEYSFWSGWRWGVLYLFGGIGFFEFLCYFWPGPGVPRGGMFKRDRLVLPVRDIRPKRDDEQQ